MEIHLYEPKAKGRNPVIKRVLSATTNSSTYYLNGKITPQKDVRRARLREREREREREMTYFY